MNIEADLRIITRNFTNEFNVNHSIIVRHLEQSKRSKFSINQSRVSYMKIKKVVASKCLTSLPLRNKNDSVANRAVTCNGLWYLTTYDVSSIVVLKQSSWTLSKAEIEIKKDHSETNTSEKYCRKINEMHRKLQCQR